MTACLLRFVRLLPVALVAASLSMPSAAATIYVTSLSDVRAEGDGCSLREAILNANGDSQAGSFECEGGSGADIIVLPPGRIQLQLGGEQEDDLSAALSDLDISDDLEIVGGGQQLSVLDGFLRGRFFDVERDVTLTLRRLTLERGSVSGDGGAIRVARVGKLRLEDVRIDSSSASGTGGRGGAIFMGEFTELDMRRTAFSGNTAPGIAGRGGAVYCAACTVLAHAATLAGNRAGYEGGALFIGGDARASLSFSTLAANDAPTGASLLSAGDLTLKAVLSADNGAGALGDDVECLAGGSFVATYSFAEFPSLECQPVLSGVAGLMSRSDLSATAASYGNLLKQDWRDWQASTSYVWVSSNAQSPQVVPANQCVEPEGGTRLRDQLGRLLPVAADCDLGAAQFPGRFGASVPVLSSTAGGADTVITLWANTGQLPVGVVDRDTRLVLRDAPGAAEACGFGQREATILAGSQTVSLLVDPDLLFGGSLRPGLADRTCELQAEVLAGDPRVLGASSEPVRIRHADPRALVQYSFPGNNQTLDVGFVPVGGSGVGNILFGAPAPGWTYTVAPDAIEGDTGGRFSVGAGTFPVSDSAAARTSLPVTCNGNGVPGSATASLRVTLRDDTGTPLAYTFGLRCEVGHTVTLVAEPRPISEGESTRVTIQLDSPSVLEGPFTVRLRTLGASVDSEDIRFEPGDATVTFAPGEREKYIDILAVDDDLVESAEEIEVGIELQGDLPVRTVGATSLTVTVLSEDALSRILAFSSLEQLALPPPAPAVQDLCTGGGVPGAGASWSVEAGSLIQVRSVLRNDSHVAVPAMTSLVFSLAVDRPVWVRSFVIQRCAGEGEALPGDAPVLGTCQLSPSQRSATCRFFEPLPVGGRIAAAAILEMAEVEDAPSIEVPGVMRLTVSASAGGVPVTSSVEQPYRIRGTASGGGGAFALPVLGIACLLALRGRSRRRAAGRGGLPRT